MATFSQPYSMPPLPPATEHFTHIWFIFVKPGVLGLITTSTTNDGQDTKDKKKRVASIEHGGQGYHAGMKKTTFSFTPGVDIFEAVNAQINNFHRPLVLTIRRKNIGGGGSGGGGITKVNNNTNFIRNS
mmetsp:Transcript_58576/g.68426  ORF Transcript_58576/g.68426 Transcript_58576/m.68426 type:complete len:129 (-) Transcript_58576:2415-2801(-)